MIYKWYPITSKTEFDALNIISKTYDLIFSDIGAQTITISKGAYYGLMFNNTYVVYDLNARKPFWWDNVGITIEDDIIYLGIATA